jgi:hypothetical protein
MHGIREVVLTIGDRILGITRILALITRTWHPNDTLETCASYLIYYRLEEIMEGFIGVGAIS